MPWLHYVLRPLGLDENRDSEELRLGALCAVCRPPRVTSTTKTTTVSVPHQPRSNVLTQSDCFFLNIFVSSKWRGASLRPCSGICLAYRSASEYAKVGFTMLGLFYVFLAMKMRDVLRRVWVNENGNEGEWKSCAEIWWFSSKQQFYGLRLRALTWCVEK